MIPVAEPFLGEQELSNVIEAVKSGWISSAGKFIPEFEERFSALCGSKYGVATSNGTVALHLALTALGIGRGDEVIVPTLTFAATANSAIYTGATPVFVDSCPESWTIDPARIEEAITPRTRALVPVHLYGHPCDMDPVRDIARRHGLFVVEDAAEAHGAEYRGRTVGSLGDVACFSFYGNKIITTGEGGMCLTDDEKLAARMRILRDHGMNPSRRYWHDMVGFNYRMTNMQAAVGVAQTSKMKEFIAKKRAIAQLYSQGLKELEEQGRLKLHPEMPWAKCVYWLYSILIQDSFGLSRKDLIERLQSAGIETRPLFHPLHLMPPYHTDTRLPIAEELSATGISLPSAVNLGTEQVEYITAEIIKLKS